MYIEQEDILKHISAKPFHLISEAADELGVEAYVIGGYVRDIFLHRPSKDIDVVAVGSGIELAKAVARKLGRGAYLSVFKNFGTAQVKAGDLELARERQNFAQEVINVICHYRGNIVGGKRIMKLIGLDLGKNRTPFQNMTDEEEAAMKAELEAINFFERCNK